MATQRTGKLKLTEEMAAAIIELLEAGNYRSVAARKVGIAESTFAQWMVRNRAPYTDFQRRVHEAEAEAERRQLEKVVSSEETVDAKWYLARKYPDRWAETRRVNVSGRIEQGARLNADALKDPEARQHILGLASWLFQQDGTDPDANDDGESDNGEEV